MSEYHKINTIYNRDQKGHIIETEFSDPLFDYLFQNQWVWTEKVDGTNIRIIWDGEQVTFGGRTDNAQIPATLIKKLQDLFLTPAMTEKLKSKLPDGAILYGEGYGSRIQKGGGNYNPNGVDFVLFDIQIGGWYLTRSNVGDIADALGIDIVPVVGIGTLEKAIEFVRNGFISQWGDFFAEGIVARPLVEMKNRKGNRVIVKIKHRDFHVTK